MAHTAELLIGITQLDVADDQITVRRTELLEGGPVLCFALVRQHLLQGRGANIGHRVAQRGGCATSCDVAVLIADAVQNGLPKIRRECVPSLYLSVADPPKGSHQRLLHEIRRVHSRSGEALEPSVGPPVQTGHTTGDQVTECSAIAKPGTGEQDS